MQNARVLVCGSIELLFSFWPSFAFSARPCCFWGDCNKLIGTCWRLADEPKIEKYLMILPGKWVKSGMKLTTVVIFSERKVARIRHMNSGSAWWEDVDSDRGLLLLLTFFLAFSGRGFGFVFPLSRIWKTLYSNFRVKYSRPISEFYVKLEGVDFSRQINACKDFCSRFIIFRQSKLNLTYIASLSVERVLWNALCQTLASIWIETAEKAKVKMVAWS